MITYTDIPLTFQLTDNVNTDEGPQGYPTSWRFNVTKYQVSRRTTECPSHWHVIGLCRNLDQGLNMQLELSFWKINFNSEYNKKVIFKLELKIWMKLEYKLCRALTGGNLLNKEACSNYYIGKA